MVNGSRTIRIEINGAQPSPSPASGEATGGAGRGSTCSPRLQLGWAVCVGRLSMTAKRLVAVASPGAASSSGELRWRSTGREVEIGRRSGAMSSGEVARRLREKRGGRWCEGIGAGGPPFIAARRGRGAAMRSSSTTRLQGRRCTGDDARVLAMSMRSRCA